VLSKHKLSLSRYIHSGEMVERN